MKREHFDDPVDAYNRMGKNYAELCRRREQYLRSVERCVLERIPAGSGSLLDIGAGDGRRALSIAGEARIRRVVLLEPSAGILAQPIRHVEVWQIRAEDLNAEAISERFDVITCLWNVLGHLPNAAARQRALTAISRLLTPAGQFFLDVNHRYSVRSYGIALTAARWIRDQIVPGETNGNVRTKWHFGDRTVSTYGHVFTDREILRLAESAGLECEQRILIDYDDGRIRRFPFSGNLFYIFRRSSRIESSSAPQTS